MKSLHKLLFLGLVMGTLVQPMMGCVTGSTTRGPRPSPSPNTTTTGGTTGSTTGQTTGQQSETFLQNGATNVFDIAQDADFVYWTQKVNNNSFVFQTRKDGTQTTPTTLAQSGNAQLAWGIATDADPSTGNGDASTVFFTLNQPNPQGALQSVSVANGTVGQVQTIASGLNKPTFVRFNSQAGGGDGLLYLCENLVNAGQILRYDPATANQTEAAGVFVTGLTVPPPYNLRIVPLTDPTTKKTVTTLFFTCMADDLSTGNQGTLRAIQTTATSTATAPATVSQTTLVATGLLNPTDTLVDPVGGVAYWTEYDTQNGSLKSIALTAGSLGGRGTTVNTGGSPINPAAAIGAKFIDSNNDLNLVVSQNLTQGNGGDLVGVNTVTGVATILTTQQTNFPFQFVADPLTGTFYITEFNFLNGAEASATNPSRVDAITNVVNNLGTGQQVFSNSLLGI